MLLLEVCRKNLISSLRGEYIDFIVSRFVFTILTMATSVVIFSFRKGQVSRTFMEATGSADYLGFMIIGTALYATTQGILLNVSRTLMTERREGTLEAVLIIPFQRWAYYGGNQLHQLMLTGIDILLMVVMAAVFGVSFHPNLLHITAALIQFFITLYGLALLVSLLMISLRDTFFIQNTILPVILLIGGYLFPVEVLPVPLRILSEIIPVYKGVYRLRDAVMEGTAFIADGAYLFSLVPGVIFLFAGYLLLPWIERRALEDYLS